MIHVITAVGLLAGAAGLFGLAQPARLAAAVARLGQAPKLRPVLVVLRIAIGGVFILAAQQTPWPLLMKILGVVVIMAGTLMTMLSAKQRGAPPGPQPGRIRLLSLAAVAAGAFLVHASW